MSVRRLKETSPVSKAVNEVFELMFKLGVEFQVREYGKVSVTHNGKEYWLLDLEASLGDYNQGIHSLPPAFEHKLVFDDEE